MQVDIVDLNNRTIGRSIRRELFAKKQNFRTIHIILKSEQGQIILQRLPLNHARSPGRLGSSVAGYLQAGESYEDAAYRKLYEELRLSVPLRRLGEVDMIDNGSHKFVGVFTGEADRRPQFDPSEIAELVYVDLPRLDGMVRTSPDLFTRTFLHVYQGYRAALA